MESSGILGCEHGGTSGTESGWTTYIASAIHENHHDGHHHDVDDGDDHYCTYKQADNKTGNFPADDNDGESDDSMASDASSGPNRQDFQSKISEISVGAGSFKHGNSKYSSRGKKIHKQVEQKGAKPWIKVEEQELEVVRATSAASHVYGDSKVKKA